MDQPATDRRRSPRRILFSGEYILRWGAVLLLGGVLAGGCTPSRPLLTAPHAPYDPPDPIDPPAQSPLRARPHVESA